jgi:hypothetical protein
MDDQDRTMMLRDIPRGASPAHGIALGARVLSLDGALPVEHLLPGDRVITRRGVRRLVSIERQTLAPNTPVVSIRKSALGGMPDRALWALPTQHILLRGWRADAISGRSSGCVPLHQIVDGEYIRWSKSGAGDAVLQLTFSAPEVIYADGLELAVGAPVTTNA